jgi:hypothetical protein
MTDWYDDGFPHGAFQDAELPERRDVIVQAGLATGSGTVDAQEDSEEREGNG